MCSLSYNIVEIYISICVGVAWSMGGVEINPARPYTVQIVNTTYKCGKSYTNYGDVRSFQKQTPENNMYYLYTFNKISFEPVHIMLSKCLTYSTNKFVDILLIAIQLLISLYLILKTILIKESVLKCKHINCGSTQSIHNIILALKQRSYVKKITSMVQVNLLYILLLYTCITNYVPLFVSLVSYKFGAGDTIDYNRNLKFICDDLFYLYMFYMCMIECTVINTLCCLLLYQAFHLNNKTRQKHLAINVIRLIVSYNYTYNIHFPTNGHQIKYIIHSIYYTIQVHLPLGNMGL